MRFTSMVRLRLRSLLSRTAVEQELDEELRYDLDCQIDEFVAGGMRAGLAESIRGSAGNTWRRLGSKLVVVELATAVVLLVGAGLLGKSLFRLLRVNIGLQPDRLIALRVGAPPATYAKDEQVIALQREIFRQVGALPGVIAIGISSSLPVTSNGNTTWFRVLGRAWHGEHNEVPERDVSSTYFTALGARLVRA